MSLETVFEASLDYFLGPIQKYLNDPQVTEVMVNGIHQIYLERSGQLELTSSQFESEESLLAAVRNIAQYVGREIDEQRPVLDARLPDGSRVHAIIPPASRSGVCLTIRKFKQDILGLSDFVRLKSISDEAREFLEICVKLRKNIVISGGTGTGKTTFLNALSNSIPEKERIVVIEDSSELRLAQQHTLYLESSPKDARQQGGMSIRQLFSASLRMRPDRIIMGEVRGGEALDMVQAMLSGHSGGMTTVHANTPRDSLVRLETLALMSDVELPVYVARAQVASAIHLIVQLARYTEDGSRRVTRITEARELSEKNQYLLKDLFVMHHNESSEEETGCSELSFTGDIPTFTQEIYEYSLEGAIDKTTDLWNLKGKRS